jgi:nucleotide-binding universal stress UspA family protein
MIDDKKNRGVSPKRVSYAPEALRSLLVPLDLSALSDRVVGRVTQLPLAQGACVTLLHVVPKTLPPRDQRRAERDAKKMLADERRSLVKAMPKGVAVDGIVRIGAPVSEITACARALEAELVVIGRGGGRGLRDFFLGSTAERVIRRGQLPVLAVRLPARRPYQRPALALDVDRGLDQVLGPLLRLLPPACPRVTIIHAYDVPYRGLVYPSLCEEDAEEDFDQYRQRALDKLTQRLATALARSKVQANESPSWRIRVRLGDPRSVIRKTVTKDHTDLLALATRGNRGVAHALLGTVAGDVLRQVACDVLVVPPRRKTATTASWFRGRR